MNIDLPTARRLGAWPTGSPQWHAARANGLGGSEIAAVLGLSKWESPYSLWHRKAGLTGEPDLSDEMEAGTLLEPVILSKWEDKQAGHLTLMQLPSPSFPAPTYCHVDRPWQIANPDGRAVVPGSERVIRLVEAKYALYDDEFGDPGTDDIPIYYRTQCLWYLDVTGLDTIDLEVFIGSQGQFRTYTLHAQPDEQRLMREAGAAFLDTLPGRPNERAPDIDTHTATYQTVRKMHPQIDDLTVELDADLARAYCDARQILKAAEDTARQQTARVAQAMGNAHKATHLTQVIARRQARGDSDPYVVAARNLPTYQ